MLTRPKFRQKEGNMYAECTVNGCSVHLQLDSAADVTILDKDKWIAIGKPSLSPIDGVLIGVGNYAMSTQLD